MRLKGHYMRIAQGKEGFRKIARNLLIAVVILLAFWTALNIETTTKQAINYKVEVIKVPLYLKISSFLDRHLNYRWLTGRILEGQKTDSQKAKAVFQWTSAHIAKQPPELSIIDDHVWHIIVRGYGISDQSADVFATLSNYAGLRAFILDIQGPIGVRPNHIYVGAVYFDGAWHLCDPYNRTEFVNHQGNWASIREIMSGDWKVTSRQNIIHGQPPVDYPQYFRTLGQVDFDAFYRGSRSSIQDPFSRFLYFFRKGKNGSE